jgi:TetR/AcrR family transcriptional repressor of uid operon
VRTGDDRSAVELRRRRQAVLDEARRLFAERGYDGVTMAMVADASATGRSAILQLFPDRRALLAAVVANDVEQLIGRLTLAIPESASVDRMLRVGYGVFLDFVDSRRADFEILFGTTERIDPLVGALIGDLRDQLGRAYQRIFQPILVAEGFAPASSAEARLLTQAMIALAEGATMAWISEPSLPRDRVIELVTGMIRSVLLPEKPEGGARRTHVDGPPADWFGAAGDETHGDRLTRSSTRHAAQPVLVH